MILAFMGKKYFKIYFYFSKCHLLSIDQNLLSVMSFNIFVSLFLIEKKIISQSVKINKRENPDAFQIIINNKQFLF